MILRLVFFLCALALNTPCSNATTTITVFAAASLTDVLQAIAKPYAQTKQAYTVRFSFAASSTLAQQIRAGAEADIFFSANQAWMDKLTKLGYIHTSRTLLSNRLVAIVPQSTNTNTFDVSQLQDWLRILGSTGRIALGDPDHVPVGIYAKSALQTLGLWSALQHRLAPTENVRVALMWVIRQESPIGIVYQSDLRISTKVQLLTQFPTNSYPKITYSLGIIAKHNKPHVQHLFQFLLQQQTQKIYQSYGFDVL